MFTIQQAITAADLYDEVDRLMLADLMEAEGRNDEAQLLRADGLALVCLADDTIWWDQRHNGLISDETEFFLAYLECILFSETDDDGEPLDRHYSFGDFSVQAILQAWKDCCNFIKDNHNLIGNDYGRAGRNFWWNRNGHGIGFWCNWDIADIGETLSDACDYYGECDAEVGDDGRIYLYSL